MIEVHQRSDDYRHFCHVTSRTVSVFTSCKSKPNQSDAARALCLKRPV